MNRTKLKRFLAVLTLLLILSVLVSLVICLIRGSSPALILAHLFCLMIIPCMIYAFRLLINGRKNRQDKQTN